MGRRPKRWPQTSCSKCGAEPGQPCVTKTGNPACMSHSARPLMTEEEREQVRARRAELDARWIQPVSEAAKAPGVRWGPLPKDGSARALEERLTSLRRQLTEAKAEPTPDTVWVGMLEGNIRRTLDQLSGAQIS